MVKYLSFIKNGTGGQAYQSLFIHYVKLIYDYTCL